MKNPVVFVTGAGQGSGKAIAKRFLSDGAIVAATDLRAPEWDAGVAESRLIRMAVDVSKEEQVIAAIDKVNKETSGINVLVNNAGIAIDSGELVGETIELFRKMMSVNLEGVFFTTRQVLRNLEEKKMPGAIINISSINGKNGFPAADLYGATKAGVIGFTRCLAAEVGKYDITVNAICPGSVNTPMIRKVIESISEGAGISIEDAEKIITDRIPMGRLQEPEDVASLCAFLASDGARNISGESINLDGGQVRD